MRREKRLPIQVKRSSGDALVNQELWKQQKFGDADLFLSKHCLRLPRFIT